MEPAQEPVKDLEPVHVGSKWQYKGKTYVILELVKVKDPQDSNWYQGVKYKDVDNWSELPYVRYETDFLSKFRQVDFKGDPVDGSQQ